MNVWGMNHVRFETEWPCHLDINWQNEGGVNSIMAQAHLMTIPAHPAAPWEIQRVRVLLKEDTLGIHISPFPDTELPEWWKDAEVLFEHVQPPVPEKEE